MSRDETKIGRRRLKIFFSTEDLFDCVYFKVQPDLGILLLVQYQSEVFYFRNELSQKRVVEVMNKYLNVCMCEMCTCVCVCTI